MSSPSRASQGLGRPRLVARNLAPATGADEDIQPQLAIDADPRGGRTL